MTGNDLRKKVVSIMLAWVGGTKGSAVHKEILKLYNSYVPLPRAVKMEESYDWCAATVSAAWIKAGIAAYTGIECSCGRFIDIAKAKGEWIETDSITPKIGMACVYDWSDSGKGDDKTGHDHIGMVTAVDGSTFTVIEGNSGSPAAVRKKQRKVDQRYIRGFISPDYDAIAKKLTPAATKKPSLDQIVDDVISGKYGSGDARKSKLESLHKNGEIDFTYDQIQKAVNEKLDSKPKYKPLVIDGDFGTESVKRLQEFLNLKMGSHLVVDGDFGTKTAAMLQTFLNKEMR